MTLSKCNATLDPWTAYAKCHALHCALISMFFAAAGMMCTLQVVSRALTHMQAQRLFQGGLRCRLAMVRADAASTLIFDEVLPPGATSPGQGPDAALGRPGGRYGIYRGSTGNLMASGHVLMDMAREHGPSAGQSMEYAMLISTQELELCGGPVGVDKAGMGNASSLHRTISGLSAPKIPFTRAASMSYPQSAAMSMAPLMGTVDGPVASAYGSTVDTQGFASQHPAMLMDMGEMQSLVGVWPCHYLSCICCA